jgi:hypothetical protein
MRIHFWNLVFSVFFALLVLLGTQYLASNRLVFYDVPFRDLVLIALAIFRLVRLLSYDVITQFIRDWFVGAPQDSLRHTLGMLVNCPWCTGLWFSFLVVFFYFAAPLFAWPIIIILALAALASLFQILANLIGWAAELKKMEVKTFETNIH